MYKTMVDEPNGHRSLKSHALTVEGEEGDVLSMGQVSLNSGMSGARVVSPAWVLKDAC